jgi:2-methylaconitate isomerase
VSHSPQIRIPATYMRGGTSKGVFFKLTDLPAVAQVPGEARDRLLLRVIGSPDPYGKHTDGMGGATSSTSKTVILAKSTTRPDHDVDYLFGQVSIDQPFVDWSGNCGNLSAAVGCLRHQRAGLVDPKPALPEQRSWRWCASGRQNIRQDPPRPRAHGIGGAVQETGDFELDGVTFPAAEGAGGLHGARLDAADALFPDREPGG